MYLAVAHAFDARGVPLALRPSHYHGGDRAEAKGALAMGVELNRRRGSPLRPGRNVVKARRLLTPPPERTIGTYPERNWSEEEDEEDGGGGGSAARDAADASSDAAASRASPSSSASLFSDVAALLPSGADGLLRKHLDGVLANVEDASVSARLPGDDVPVATLAAVYHASARFGYFLRAAKRGLDLERTYGGPSAVRSGEKRVDEKRVDEKRVEERRPESPEEGSSRPSPSPAEETLAGIATGASSFSSGALGIPLGQRPSPANAPKNASASGAALNAMTLRAFGGGSEMSTKAAMEAAAARATQTRSRATEVTRSFPKTSTGALPPFPASVGDWVEDPDATARRARLTRAAAAAAASAAAAARSAAADPHPVGSHPEHPSHHPEQPSPPSAPPRDDAADLSAFVERMPPRRRAALARVSGAETAAALRAHVDALFGRGNAESSPALGADVEAALEAGGAAGAGASRQQRAEAVRRAAEAGHVATARMPADGWRYLVVEAAAFGAGLYAAEKLAERFDLVTKRESTAGA